MVLIWFGNGAPFSGFLTGWLQERKRKQPRDSLLVDFSRVLVVLIWFCCGFDMVLIRFWYDFDMIWYGFDTVLIWFQWVGFKKKKQKQPRDRFLVDFSSFFFWFWYDFDILIRFWYAFDTILIRFWYDFDTVLIWFQWVGFRKRNRNSPGTGFWSIFQGFFLWFWFDLILIRFWYDFDTLLIRFWYDFDMVLIRFWIWFRWVGFKSQVWPTSRIITETISKSYLKPYQHHNCKTTPETIHNSKSYLKRIKIIKTFILKYFILEISDVINLAAVNIPRGLAYVDVRDRMSKNRFLRHLQYFRMVFLQWLPFFIHRHSTSDMSLSVHVLFLVTRTAL